MKRRDFLKGALTLSILAPVFKLTAKSDGKTEAPAAAPGKVLRRTLN